MPMTVAIQELHGAGPTSTDVSSSKFNREDTVGGSTPIPIPSNPGTNFSWVKSLIVNISATGGLTMTNIRVGKVSNEPTGYKVWHVTSHALGAYVQAASPPTPTGDNNVTAPTLNSAAATALPLTSAPPAVYAAGPFATTGQKGNLVELSLGIDGTALSTGTAVNVTTVRWSWTEA
jgi:hypothetical protein